MKIYYRPTVYLVAQSEINWQAIDELLDAEYDGDQWQTPEANADVEALPEFMGRLCYGSFGARQGRKGATDYLAHILEAGHGSVLEHATFSFVVCRASRGFTHEMVRHRAGFSYSQESTRFVKYGEDAAVCLPELTYATWGNASGEDVVETTVAALEHALAEYGKVSAMLAASGGKRKDLQTVARQILPTALQSRIGFTANARALRHFCELRGKREAAPEIRLVAHAVCKLLSEAAPALFGDFTFSVGDDGFPVLSCKWSKV